MKKTSHAKPAAAAAFLALATAFGTQAANAADAAGASVSPAAGESLRSEAFIGFETGWLGHKWSGKSGLFTENTGGFFGVNVNGGVRFARSATGSVVVGGELGIWGHSEKYYDQVNVPVLATLAYEFNLNHNTRLKVGVHAGFTILSGEFNNGAERYFARDRNSFSQAAGTGGIHVGGSWDFAPQWTLSTTYKFSANSAVKVMEGRSEESSQMHNFTIGVSRRW